MRAGSMLLLLSSPPAASLAAGLWAADANVRLSLATARAADVVGYHQTALWLSLVAVLPIVSVALQRWWLGTITAVICMATWSYFVLLSLGLGGVFAPGVGIYLSFLVAGWAATRRMLREGARRRWAMTVGPLGLPIGH